MNYALAIEEIIIRVQDNIYIQMISITADILTVFLTAALLSLPIEDGQFWIAAFVALVPLLLRIYSRSYLSIFFISFSSFFLYLFYVLQWIDVYGFHWRIFLVFMNALSYGALFVAAFWMLRKFNHHLYALLLPSLFVLLEFKQSIGFLGFPWPLLCHSQWSNLALIQIASLGGCWLVTFVIVHVNEALAHLIAGGFKPRVLPAAVLPILLVGISGLWGAVTLSRQLPQASVQVMIVQGSQATNLEWTPVFNRRAIEEYTELTTAEFMKEEGIVSIDKSYAEGEESVTSTESWLVIWPETAIPDAMYNPVTRKQISKLASQFNATFLVGCLTLQPADGKPLDSTKPDKYSSEYREYNSFVVFEPDGSIIPAYSKIHLVPFGEVIPLKDYIVNWFPRYPWGSNDIYPGTGFHATRTKAGVVGGVICYESFFPQYVRKNVLSGAQILVLGSNTSWFQRTRATYQHARFDVFRAVENGIWFCRAATTGVSSAIDPHGRVLVETRMFEPDAVTVPIGLRKGLTIYTRFGDWVPACCALFTALTLLGAFLVKEPS